MKIINLRKRERHSTLCGHLQDEYENRSFIWDKVYIENIQHKSKTTICI